MCCAHSGNKGRESGGRAAGRRQSRTYRRGGRERGSRGCAGGAAETMSSAEVLAGNKGRESGGGAAGQGRGACDGEDGINFDSFSGG